MRRAFVEPSGLAVGATASATVSPPKPINVIALEGASNSTRIMVLVGVALGLGVALGVGVGVGVGVAVAVTLGFAEAEGAGADARRPEGAVRRLRPVLADDLGVAHDAAPSGAYGLIVNATTVGLDEANRAASEADSEREPGAALLKALPLTADAVSAEVVMDLVYGILETPIVRAARAAGATVVDGLEVLVRQGAASFRIWTGVEPPIDVMRAAARCRRARRMPSMMTA